MRPSGAGLRPSSALDAALRFRRRSIRAGHSAQRSPLVDFQLDTREVKHMSPHVLSAAVLSAGSSGHSGQALWQAYKERALGLRAQMTRRDLRLLLQGFAEGSVRDAAFFRSLLENLSWDQKGSASKLDLCSIAASLARLKISDMDAFHAIGDHVVEDLEGLPFADLGTLVGAFSQGLCRHPPLFAAVAAQLEARTRAPPRELSPAVAASTLNALAICSHCDAALMDAVVHKVVLPRVSEFGTAHVALIANSLTRCEQAPSAAESLSLLAHRWTPHGHVRRASVQELTYLAQAYAQLRVADCPDLNLALASSAVGQLSSFEARHLSGFCGALRWLPSTGRAAFLAMAARHALVGVLPECSLAELGVLLDALVATQTAIPESVVCEVFSRVAAKAQEAAAAGRPGPAGNEGPTDGHAVSSYTLATLAVAGTRLLDAEQGQHLLTALRPHVSALSHQKRLKAPALGAILAAHAHFHVRDLEILEQIGGAAACLPETAPPSHIEQMLVSLAGLDAPIEPLLGYIDAQVGGAARELSLDGASQCLLAVAVLGPERFSGHAVEALLLRARELSAEAPPGAAAASRLAAAARGLAGDQGVAAEGEAWPCWLEAARGAPHGPEPPPPPGLLRSVYRALRCGAGDGAELSAGEPAEGFHADLVLRRGGSATAVEVDGPQRFYHASREALGICRLKHRALEQLFGKVVRIGFWEWPAQEEAQLELLRARGIA